MISGGRATNMVGSATHWWWKHGERGDPLARRRWCSQRRGRNRRAYDSRRLVRTHYAQRLAGDVHRGMGVTIPSISLELRRRPLPTYMVAPTRVDCYIPRLQVRAIDSRVPAQVLLRHPGRVGIGADRPQDVAHQPNTAKRVGTVGIQHEGLAQLSLPYAESLATRASPRHRRRGRSALTLFNRQRSVRRSRRQRTISRAGAALSTVSSAGPTKTPKRSAAVARPAMSSAMPGEGVRATRKGEQHHAATSSTAPSDKGRRPDLFARRSVKDVGKLLRGRGRGWREKRARSGVWRRRLPGPGPVRGA